MPGWDRNIRGEMNVPPELKADVLIKTKNHAVLEVIEQNMNVITFLSRINTLTYGEAIVKPQGCASAVGNGYEVYLPLKGLIDLEKEKVRLNKEMQKLGGEIERSRIKLDNELFVRKAPESVVGREKERLETNIRAYERITGILASLQE